jgi:hypothetical protein
VAIYERDPSAGRAMDNAHRFTPLKLLLPPPRLVDGAGMKLRLRAGRDDDVEWTNLDGRRSPTWLTGSPLVPLPFSNHCDPLVTSDVRGELSSLPLLAHKVRPRVIA